MTLTEANKYSGHVYGSFLLGNTEIAVEVSFVQEVVNYPEIVNAMPLAPDFLIGIFNLRGIIIPIVNLKKILKIEETSQNPKNQKVAIIEFEGACLGFVFDSTGEILRVRDDDKNDFKMAGSGSSQVIKGVLKLDNGSRLLQILDPSALVKIENIPQIHAATNGHRRNTVAQSKHAQRKKCITFSVNNMKMAFEIHGIHEIVMVPELQNSALNSEICLGMMNVRGQVVPVVQFSKILDRKSQDSNRELQDRRIIILRLESEFFGLLVDSVESIDSYSLDAIMPVPLLSKERVKMFDGCISLPNNGDVFLLNHEAVLSNEEIAQITHGHSRLYQSQNWSGPEKTDTRLRGC